jgi:hypothetical protein
VTLSPEFAYEVKTGTVYVGAFQGAYPATDEGKLGPGDVIDSVNAVTAFTFDEAVLNQYSQDEEVPKKPEPKSKSKKK